jgi:hypothetical protein
MNSNLNQAATVDRRMSSANESKMSPTTLLLRKLPKSTTPESLRTMLLFAKDLKDADLVPNELDEDVGFATAVARFTSINSAAEARAMLDGKPNTAGQGNMIVNVISGPALSALGRRNTLDPQSARKMAQTVSPVPNHTSKPSRFNGTFQAMDRTSPPAVGSPPQPSDNMHSIFAPSSPNATMKDRRMTGKLMIGEEGGDEDTGDLIKDPLAYINSQPAPRQRGAQPPIAAFGALSLNTDMHNGLSGPRMTSPQSAHPYQNHGAFSPAGGPRSAYPGPTFLRHNYPPVNPADQNPPCNTLYVGNLPIDTSEDELKALFSKQRGYKRLCFRTKQNGPMCFVEFEDISFATKALNELYGVQLHNSVKGGIRLSFSKNPLGVRAGQPGSNNPHSAMNGAGSMGISSPTGMTPPGFSSVNGPPPGLGMPMAMSNGSTMPAPIGSPPITGPFMHQGAGTPGSRSVQMPSGSGLPHLGSTMYPDYMMGR